MTGKYFGTDGVRGVANKELTAELAFDLGRAGAYVLTREGRHSPRILIGTDTRLSGDMLEGALVAGMCSVGAHVMCAGVMPTPAVAFLVRKYGYDAGVVISASHNPFTDNGIKFFSNEGYKLKDSLEDEIEDVMESKIHAPSPEGEGIGAKIQPDEPLDEYLEFLISTLGGLKLDGFRVAIDCANGAGYKAGPLLFTELGADTKVIHNEPNGVNINLNCGSTHTESLAEFVKETGANIGVALDGDCDRCMLVDETGQVIDGDEIMAILALDMKDRGELDGDTLVATVMSNLGLLIMAKENGINIETTKVGDRYVLERMLEKGYTLGGEQSGHIIFLKYNPTGDGLLTAIQVLSVMKRTGKKLSELRSVMQVLPQVLVNARVDNAKKNLYLENEEIKAEIDALEAKFSGEGRVLIRPSGTEPLVRVMIEGKNKEEMQRDAVRLAGLITKLFGK